MSGLLLILVVVLFVVVMNHRNDADARFEKFEKDLAAIRRELWATKGKGKTAAPPSKAADDDEDEDEDEEALPAKPLVLPKPPATKLPIPPLPPLRPTSRPAAPRPPAPRPVHAAAPAAAPVVHKAPQRPVEPRVKLPSIDWEQFTGVKLFAWLGGLALFLAAGFFVKYSIDNNLLPPALRLAIAALTGLLLIGGSFAFEPKRYAVLRQSLAAGGVGVLFAVIFAATLYYRFIGTGPGFGLLALTAMAAFVLAVAQKAPATAVLGALGAWIALVLVEPGQATLPMLFAYLAVVGLSLHQVARRLDLAWLSAYGSLGTLAALWAAQSSVAVGASPLAQAGAWTGQFALFTAAVWRMPWDPRKHDSLGLAAALSFAAALGCGAMLLPQPGLMPGLVAAATMGLQLLVGMRQRPWAKGTLMGALLSWVLILAWAISQPMPAASPGGLALLLGYGLLGGLGPVLLLRDPDVAKEMRQWLLVYPVALLVLGLAMVFSHPSLPPLFWPVDLLLQLLGLGMALIAGALFVAMLSLLGLLFSVALWLGNPTSLAALAGPFFYAALLFGGLGMAAAMLWLAPRVIGLRRQLGLDTAVQDAAKDASFDTAILMPWLTATPVLGAFLLLGMVLQRLDGQSPQMAMATALSLLLVGLGLSKRLGHSALGAVTALSAVLALAAWAIAPPAGLAPAALAWSLGFWLLLTISPFVLYKPVDGWRDAWCGHAVAAAAAALMAILLARLQFSAQQVAPGLVLVALVQLMAVAALLPSLNGKPDRNSILAFWGAALLFFVSSIPVLLLDHGWLGLALVFEGAGLVWLNGRVQHPLLPVTGLGMALYGLGSMVAGYGAMRGADASPMVNPGFLSFAVATVLQTLAALEARRQSPGYPQGWRLGQRWTAVGLGFYLLNLGIAEFFAGGPSNGFDLRSEGRWAQYVIYTLAWALVGSGLWAFLRKRSVMAWVGLGLLFLAVGRALLLPFFYPAWVPSLGPWINAAWWVYVPLMVLLSLLRVWELRRGGGGPARAILWALLLTVFAAFKIESNSTLMTGQALQVFSSGSAVHALSQAAAWSLFGLVLLLWPRLLEREFRLFGLTLFLVGTVAAVWLPLGYASAWADSLPVLNGPWILLLLLTLLWGWMAKRQWPEGQWPLEMAPRPLLGTLALLAGFYTINVGVAQCFRRQGEALHLVSHGRLGHRLSNSLSWMAYGLFLLGLGIRSSARHLRMAGLALVALTAVKVFLGDLRELSQLYRVAAFVGLAVSLLLVSYVYQRFGQESGSNEKRKP